MKGKVKFINEEKGFGFIKPSGSSEDVFVHSSGLIDEICENDRVEFDMETASDSDVEFDKSTLLPIIYAEARTTITDSTGFCSCK